MFYRFEKRFPGFPLKMYQLKIKASPTWFSVLRGWRRTPVAGTRRRGRPVGIFRVPSSAGRPVGSDAAGCDGRRAVLLVIAVPAARLRRGLAGVVRAIGVLVVRLLGDAAAAQPWVDGRRVAGLLLLRWGLALEVEGLAVWAEVLDLAYRLGCGSHLKRYKNVDQGMS